MDKRTRLVAIASLAKSAAEIAADLAALTSEAAGHTPGTANLQNTIVGGLLPCEKQLDALQAIFLAVKALHTTEAV